MAELTAQQVDSLLDRLANDDAFRETFQKDPKAAVAELGLPPECAGCMGVKNLASKKAIAESREALRSQLVGTLAFNVHDLDAR